MPHGDCPERSSQVISICCISRFNARYGKARLRRPIPGVFGITGTIRPTAGFDCRRDVRVFLESPSPLFWGQSPRLVFSPETTVRVETRFWRANHQCPAVSGCRCPVWRGILSGRIPGPSSRRSWRSWRLARCIKKTDFAGDGRLPARRRGIFTGDWVLRPEP
jgi:hypothetical protein